MPCESSYKQCCPEIVSTINIDNSVTNVTIDGAGLTITVPAHIPGAIVSVDIQVDVAAEYLVQWWFIDNPATPGTKSVVPPTTPGAVEGEAVTDSNGTLTLLISNTNPVQIYYLVATLGNGIVVSDPIQVGV